MKPMHSHTIYSTTFDAQGRAINIPSYDTDGMTIAHYFLGQILSGLASNPTMMLNIEEHLDYAIRLAETAANKTEHWS